jgi:hypothetical protein
MEELLLKWMVQNVELKISTGLTGSRCNPVASYCDYSTEPSVSVKDEGFLE